MSDFALAEKDKEKKEKTEKTIKAPAETIQRDLSEVNGPKGGMLPNDVSARIQSMRGGGQRLSDRSLQHYSEKFGRDMSDVHVHTDTAADTISRSLNARAFTIGSDVFLTKGINPDGGGRDGETMTHELMHVVQQGGRASSGPLKLGAADTAQEHEAAATAQREFDPELKEEKTVQRESEPKLKEENTVQRGFMDFVGGAVSAVGGALGAMGGALGDAVLENFGLKTSYDSIFGGANKVKAAVRQMDDQKRSLFDSGESQVAEMEGKGPDGLQTLEEEASREMESKDDEQETEGYTPENEEAADPAGGSAVARYEKKYEEYEKLLETQLQLVKDVDSTVTESDMDHYRSGTKKNVFSMFASSIAGSFFGGFQKGDKVENSEMAKAGFADFFSKKRRGRITAKTEPETTAKPG